MSEAEGKREAAATADAQGETTSGGSSQPFGPGTVTEGGPGTGGGLPAPGDQSAEGGRDMLKELDGDVPLPAGLDEHVAVPGRRTGDTGDADTSGGS